MKDVLRFLVPVISGVGLGGGAVVAFLGILSPAPSSRAAFLPVPPADSIPAPPPVLEFFGLPCATADDASASPGPSIGSAVVRYLPVQGKCIAGFDATSTLQDIRGWTRSVSGEIRFDPRRLEETVSSEIVVEGRTLVTGDDDRDQEIHRHLESGGGTRLKFTLSRLTRGDPAGTAGSFVAKGTLEVNGKTVQVESPGSFELRRDGHLQVKGEFRVRMSQFGITPPVTALVVRVDDEVQVWFELWAKPERRDR